MEDIEVLWAVAVVMVTMDLELSPFVPWGESFREHIHPWFTGGYGVGLFLAISGFVITRDLLPRLQAARSDDLRIFRLMTALWIRSAPRLLPLGWLCLATTVLTRLLFEISIALGSVRATVAGAIAAVLRVANIRFMMNFGYKMDLGVRISQLQPVACDSPLRFIPPCALPCLASEANFRFVEVPLRRFGIRIAQRWTCAL